MKLTGRKNNLNLSTNSYLFTKNFLFSIYVEINPYKLYNSSPPPLTKKGKTNKKKNHGVRIHPIRFWPTLLLSEKKREIESINCAFENDQCTYCIYFHPITSQPPYPEADQPTPLPPPTPQSYTSSLNGHSYHHDNQPESYSHPPAYFQDEVTLLLLSVWS